MKLNARQVDTAKPKDKPYKLADGGGLYLLIKPNGGKYWRLKYRVAGKEKLLALGVYPEVTLADARAKREEAKRGIAGGIDPMEAKREEKIARQTQLNSKRAARTVLTGMCYSVGSATRQGSSSLTRFIGQ
ncbi:Arm DNA-binding domain-containing protein, partial [Klebsiella pneumoniae]|uniref:Arm DNA-binding domain-containing protein n=1 Tax=Klebsiella pneumoniae TaxID=573 RepID=UPI0039EF27DF